MADTVFLSRFTPSRTDPEILERIFVQREALAKDAVERLSESARSGNMHHLLFIGPRGSGKTHLVALIFHRLVDREDLSDRLRVAWLAEDETTTSFLKLLMRIHRALVERYPEEFQPLAPGHLQELNESGRIEWLTRLLVRSLRGRTLLVIVENLDELFKGLGDEGEKRWRAFLQESPCSATLATSQQLFDGISRRESPFFGFFQIEHLRPLTLEEAVLLLKNIAELKGDAELAAFLQTPIGRSRVRALHHLSGGSHRIYIILSEFITRESLDELVGPFEKLMDELTPYYQSRLSWLSPQQREIVEFLCRCRHAVPVKEIATQLLISHQTAAGQLKEIKEKGYVQGHAVGREARYELAEPLMRLSVEVKENNRQPIRLIIDFLRIWHSREQLEQRLQLLPMHFGVEREYVRYALREIDDSWTSYILRDLEVYRECGDERRAVEALEELAETRGQIEDWINLGNARQAAERHEKAVASFDRALAIQPDYAAVWYWRGISLGRLGRHEKALDSFDRALALQPDSAKAWCNRGTALGWLGRLKEAVESCDRALALQPDNATASCTRGIALVSLGRLEEAVESCDRALALQPDDVLAWYNRGIALGGLGRHEEAVASFDRALALAANNIWAWRNRGIALYGLGCHEEMLVSFDRALALMPDDAVAWRWRGIALCGLGRHQEAVESFDRALALMPDDAVAWVNRAITLEGLGRNEEAVESFDRALALIPDDAVAWYNRGGALGELGRHEEAVESFDRALALTPDDVWAWNNRGVDLRRLGRYKEALESFDRALAFKPDHVLAYNHRGAALIELGRHEEALDSYDRSLALKPDDVGAWGNRAIALEGLGRHEEAVESFDRALALMPDDAVAWRWRGIALCGLGRHVEAIESFDRALTLKLDDSAAYYRIETIFLMNRWDEGFEELRKYLRGFPPSLNQGAASLEPIITIMFTIARDEGLWKGHLERLVQLCADGNALSYLGIGLIRSLAAIRQHTSSAESLSSWRKVWHEVGSDRDELRMPLRVFDVGISFLVSGDQRTLLDLVQEERQILSEALGLEPDEEQP